MIRVLEKAFDLLEYMSYAPGKEYRLAELAHVTGDAPNTAANILKTMVAREYVSRGSVRGTYRLGPMAAAIPPASGLDAKLLRAAAVPMGELAEALQGSGVLSVLRGREKRVLARYRSESPVEVRAEVVTSQSLFSTSTGIVLLASLPDGGDSLPDAAARAERVFGSREAFLAALDAVRRDGYYCSDRKKSIIEAAVPVHMGQRTVCAAGIYFPKLSVQGDTLTRLEQSMRETAVKIENNLKEISLS